MPNKGAALAWAQPPVQGEAEPAREGLAIRGLSVRYAGASGSEPVLALSDVDLNIAEGEFAVSYTHLTLPTTPYV